MKHFFALAKIQIMATTRSGKSKIKRSLGPLLLVLLGALFVYVGYTYANSFYDVMETLGTDPKGIISFMVSAAFFGAIMYSFYVTGNALYSTKDYDLLSALPIKTVVITTSKLLSVLLKQIALIVLIGIPSIFVYGNKSGFSADPEFIQFVLRNAVMMIFSGFLGTAISVFLGSFIAIIFSRLRHKNLIQIIFLLVVFGLFFYFISTQGGFLKLISVLGDIFFIKPLYESGMHDWLYVLIVIAIGIVAIVLITVFVTLTYKKFNALLLSKKTNKKFRLKNYSKKSLAGTLYKKEMIRLFSCPIYAVNTLIGLVLSLLAVSLMAILFKDLQEITGASFGAFVVVLLPTFYAFLYWLSPTTVASISLEGKSLWLAKSLPIPIGKLFNVKILLQLTFAIPSAIICSLILTIMLKTELIITVMIFLTGIIFAVFGAVLGLGVNLMFPKFDFESETKVVKNSLAAVMQVIIAMAFTAIFIVIVSNVSGIENHPLLFIGLSDILVLTVGIVIYSLIMTKGKTRFLKA